MSFPYMTRVAIMNQTSNPLLDLRVVHVFGDTTPELLEWNVALNPGKRSDTRNVTFGTGLGNMSNYDWWQVSWKTTQGGQEYLYSSSASFCNLVGNYLIMQGSGALTTAGSIPGAVGGGDIAKGAGTLSAELANLLLGGIARKMDKTYFKEHMLTDKDAYQPDRADIIGLTIVIHDGGKILFESPSGTSKGDYSTMAVPLPLPAK